MMCPKYQSQRSVKLDVNLIKDPRSMTEQPNDMHILRPNRSISHTEKKLAGKYIIISEYLAMLSNSPVRSGLIFSMIFLFVLKDPCTEPVAADERKNEISTTHLYL